MFASVMENIFKLYIDTIQERDSLYKALDDKDDEINKQSQIVEKLKNELEDEKQVRFSVFVHLKHNYWECFLVLLYL